MVETMQLWPDRDDVTLTAYVCDADPFFPKKRPMPAVIVCPGGGYIDLAEKEGYPVAMSFAAEGYQAFVLSYTIYSTAGECGARFPAQLIDIGKAMLTLHENASRWNLDPGRISVIGFSAGAHLCAMLATRWHKFLLSETLGAPRERFRPAAAVLIYGLFDYVIQRKFEKNQSIHPMLKGAPSRFEVTFGSKRPPIETLEEYSPCRHVDGNTPPMFLACAADDDMIPAESSLAMAKALCSHGIPVELHMFEKGGHGFAMGHPAGSRHPDKARNCSEWVPMAKTFLIRNAGPVKAQGECRRTQTLPVNAPELRGL